MKQYGLKILLFVLFLIASISVSAYDFQVDGIYYFKYPNNVASVTFYNKSNNRTYKYSGDIVIPETVEYNGVTYTVEIIDIRAFYVCAINSFTFPSTIKTIGEEAFAACYSSAPISLPNVETIGKDAFANMENLTDVAPLESIVTLDYGAFRNCNKLKSIQFGNNLTEIGGSAFYDCRALTEVTIPNGTKKIGDSAFYGCYNLETVTLGSGLEMIERYAFNMCSIKTIYCYAIVPPTCVKGAGYNSNYYPFDLNGNQTTLYVPYGTKEAYSKADGWSKIKNIIEMESSGIVSSKVDVEETSIYTLNGNKIIAPQKGINIIKSKDGRSKKVFVR